MESSASERFWNVITHAFGIVLSLAGFYYMMDRVADQPLGIQVLCLGFCGTFAALYCASTRYHLAREPESVSFWNAVDRSAIFVTIAYCCTAQLFVVPHLAATERVVFGWNAINLSLIVIWSAALLGSLRELCLRKTLEWLSILLYVIQGAGAAIAINLTGILELPVALVLIGIAFYLVGVLWFFRQQHKPFYHAVWHVFVLAGSGFHFAALWVSV